MIELIKNIEHSVPVSFASLADRGEDPKKIMSLAERAGVVIKILSFSAGEGIGTHSANGDAMLFVQEGIADVTVGDKQMDVKKGEILIMPANVPHQVMGKEDMKAIVVLVKHDEN